MAGGLSQARTVTSVPPGAGTYPVPPPPSLALTVGLPVPPVSPAPAGVRAGDVAAGVALPRAARWDPPPRRQTHGHADRRPATSTRVFRRVSDGQAGAGRAAWLRAHACGGGRAHTRGRLCGGDTCAWAHCRGCLRVWAHACSCAEAARVCLHAAYVWCTCVCVHVYGHVYVCVHTCVFMYACPCAHTSCMSMFWHVCVHTCVCTHCTRVLGHLCVHAHACAHTDLCALLCQDLSPHAVAPCPMSPCPRVPCGCHKPAGGARPRWAPVPTSSCPHAAGHPWVPLPSPSLSPVPWQSHDTVQGPPTRSRPAASPRGPSGTQRREGFRRGETEARQGEGWGLSTPHLALSLTPLFGACPCPQGHPSAIRVAPVTPWAGGTLSPVSPQGCTEQGGEAEGTVTPTGPPNWGCWDGPSAFPSVGRVIVTCCQHPVGAELGMLSELWVLGAGCRTSSGHWMQGAE